MTTTVPGALCKLGFTGWRPLFLNACSKSTHLTTLPPIAHRYGSLLSAVCLFPLQCMRWTVWPIGGASTWTRPSQWGIPLAGQCRDARHETQSCDTVVSFGFFKVCAQCKLSLSALDAQEIPYACASPSWLKRHTKRSCTLFSVCDKAVVQNKAILKQESPEQSPTPLPNRTFKTCDGIEYINSGNNACVSSNAALYSEIPRELHVQ